MPFFKKAVEEVPPTFYEATIARLNSVVSSIEKHVPTPDQVQPYIDKFVENRVYLLTALFVLFTIVLCAPDNKKKVEDEQQRDEKSRQLEDMLNINKEEISELTATSSISGASNEDDESDDESEQDMEDDIDDDASVEHTYNDFLQTEPVEAIADDSSDAAISQDETPVSSPPVSDDERSTTSSIRSTLKKRMSFKISSKSFRRSSTKSLKST